MTHFEPFELLTIFDDTLIHFETNKTTLMKQPELIFQTINKDIYSDYRITEHKDDTGTYYILETLFLVFWQEVTDAKGPIKFESYEAAKEHFYSMIN